MYKCQNFHNCNFQNFVIILNILKFKNKFFNIFSKFFESLIDFVVFLLFFDKFCLYFKFLYAIISKIILYNINLITKTYVSIKLISNRCSNFWTHQQILNFRITLLKSRLILKITRDVIIFIFKNKLNNFICLYILFFLWIFILNSNVVRCYIL